MFGGLARLQSSNLVAEHRAMLDGLDDVDWVNLEHAFGPAGDVSAMIKGFASIDAMTRSAAYNDACENIYGVAEAAGEKTTL